MYFLASSNAHRSFPFFFLPTLFLSYVHMLVNDVLISEAMEYTENQQCNRRGRKVVVVDIKAARTCCHPSIFEYRHGAMTSALRCQGKHIHVIVIRTNDKPCASINHSAKLSASTEVFRSVPEAQATIRIPASEDTKSKLLPTIEKSAYFAKKKRLPPLILCATGQVVTSSRRLDVLL